MKTTSRDLCPTLKVITIATFSFAGLLLGGSWLASADAALPTTEPVTKPAPSSSGWSRQLIRVDGGKIAFEGPANARVRVARSTQNPDGSGDAVLSVTIPAMDKSIPAATLASAWAKAHPRLARQARATTTTLSASDPIDSWCVGWVNYSDNDVHGKVCNIRRLDWSNGANWYLSDSVKGSAYSNDHDCWDCDRIEGFASRLYYSDADNTIVDWAPIATKTDINSCFDKSVTVTSPKTNTSYTESTEVCPDKFGPWNTTDQSTGAKWSSGDGAPLGDYRGIVYNDVVHSPPTATTATNLNLHLWWD